MMRTGTWVVLALLFVGCSGPEEAATPPDVSELTNGSSSLSASQRPGMGAVVYSGGVMFRVWAPFASRVWVTGDFNGWGRTELGNEFNGNFSGDVSGAVQHQKYKFIVRNQWGQDSWKADPRARRMENSSGSSIIHDAGSYYWSTRNFSTPPFREQVIYELHVGTFHDSPGFGPGTWNSAVAKLDHLRDLGINMVKVMPMAEFAGDFSWGYNPSYPFAPESAYGTPDDLKYFVDQAHARGIGVIFDVVHNHYGPSDMSMWCFSGDCKGAGGEYFYADWRANTPWSNTRPDFGRKEVRDFVRDQVMMLLHEYQADGLRWDATKFIRTVNGSEATALPEGWNMLRSLNNEIDAQHSWKISIAEDIGGGDKITQSTSAGGGGFDAQWAVDFLHPVRNAIVTGNDADRNLYAVRDAIKQRFNGNPLQRIIYTESHDEVALGRNRVPEEIWPGNAGSWASKKRSTLGAALVMTSPGIPMIFSGQEFLEDGYFAAEDPLDWNKAGTWSGITRLYRDLIRLRRNWFNNTRGLLGPNVNVHHLNNNDKVLAFHRWNVGGPGDDVVVIANFSRHTFSSYNAGFPRGGRWYVRFNSDWSGYSGDFGNTPSLDTHAYSGGKDGMPYNATFAIGPYSVVIYSQ
ncbi:MAG: alpha-amylase family glycosyl hydrolase [Myxococcaceae bacterium]